MKQTSRQKFRTKTKNKPHNQSYHKTTLPSPINDKYKVNGQDFVLNSKKGYQNPYHKKFHVRKLNKTQQSVQRVYSNDKSQKKEKSISLKLRQLIDKTKKQQIEKQTFKNQLFKQKMMKLTNTLQLKKSKNRSLRIDTESHNPSIVIKNQKSPYLQKYRFRTVNTQIQTSAPLEEDADFINEEKRKKYFFMTPFQLQELQKYEVYCAGKRRISSIKQFTDVQGNAKISIGDSIIYRYQIQSTLGQGSFGQVFKALDHKKKQQVAIKIIKNHPKFNKQAKVQIKILQIALMQDPKSHYNIVKLKHAFFFRGHACLVFQLLQINLYEFLRLNHFKGLSIDLIRRISIQILQGLMFFQKFDIIHCDLKPQNILLKQQNKTGIKIIDVGSGTFQEEQIYTYIQSRFYRAPQIILGIKYNAKIDIWSFGCILCELFTGYPVFPGQNQQQQIQMLMQILGPPPQQLIKRGSRSIKFFDGYSPKIVPNSKGKIRNPGSKTLRKKLNNCQDKKFLQFVQKCLKWLPQQRYKPNQALLDEWILQGLPEQIRQQHIQIVKSQRFSSKNN